MHHLAVLTAAASLHGVESDEAKVRQSAEANLVRLLQARAVVQSQRVLDAVVLQRQPLSPELVAQACEEARERRSLPLVTLQLGNILSLVPSDPRFRHMTGLALFQEGLGAAPSIATGTLAALAPFLSWAITSYLNVADILAKVRGGSSYMHALLVHPHLTSLLLLSLVQLAGYTWPEMEVRFAGSMGAVGGKSFSTFAVVRKQGGKAPSAWCETLCVGSVSSLLAELQEARDREHAKACEESKMPKLTTGRTKRAPVRFMAM